jgi:hypothetical protein
MSHARPDALSVPLMALDIVARLTQEMGRREKAIWILLNKDSA